MKKRISAVLMCFVFMIGSEMATVNTLAEQTMQQAQETATEFSSPMDQPQSQAPVEVTTMEMPVTEAPVSAITEAPAIETPAPAATEAPAIETPAPAATEEPVTETPAPVTTEEPVTETPAPVTTEESVTETPAPVTTEEPVTETPTPAATEEPVTETPTPAATEELATQIPDMQTPTSEGQSFVAGYVYIKRGTALYMDTQKSRMLGEFHEDAIAYAWIEEETITSTQAWIKVAFDTEKMQKAGEAVGLGYMQYGDAIPLTSEETQQLVDELKAKNEARKYEGQLLLCVAFVFAQAEGEEEASSEEPRADVGDIPEAPVQEQRMGTISAGHVNIRARAGTDAEILMVKTLGDPVVIIGETAADDGYVWYAIAMEDGIGYIREDLVELRFEEVTELNTEEVLTLSQDMLSQEDMANPILLDESAPLNLQELPVPVLVSAEQKTTTSVTLTWDAIEGVEGYAIWGRVSTTAEYSVFRSVESPTTRTDITELESGKTYYFKVSAYRTTEGEQEYGKLSNVKGVTLGLPAPEFETLKQEGNDKVCLEWSAVEGASGYSVYRREDSQSIYAYAGGTETSAKTTLTLGNVEFGKTYHYKVRAFEMVDGVKVLSPNYSGVKSITIGLPGPEWVSVTQTGADTVSLKWEPVTGAAGYSVYRATSLDGVYSYAGGTEAQDDVELTVSNLTKGARYYFKVRAYSMEDGVKVLSPQYSDVRSIEIMEQVELPVPVLGSAEQQTTTSVALTWDALEDVEGYAVWGRISTTKEYSVFRIVEDTKTQTEITGLESGKTYYFKLSTYRTVEGERAYGELSNVKGVTLGLPAPEFETLKQEGNDKVCLEWSTVEGASGYSVYRREDSQSTYAYAGGTETSAKTTLTLGNVEFGKTYHYKVRAFEMMDGVKVLSPNYSGVKSITIGLPGPEWVSVTQTGADAVSLKWEPVTGAAGYSVYRATSLNGAYSYAGGTEAQDDVGLTVSNLTKGARYYFKVRAYSMEDGVKVLSPQYSDVRSIEIMEQVELPVPVLVSAEQKTTTSVTLTWDVIEGAEGYAIWGRVSTTPEYSIFKSVESTVTQTDITELESGKTYYFKVSVYRTTGGEKEYGKLSNVKGVTLGLPAPEFETLRQEGNDRVSLEWSEVEGASGYSVYRREDSQSTYAYAGGTETSAKTTLTLGNVEFGKTYHYKVRAFEMVDGVKVLSPNYSRVKSITIGLPGPEWVSVTQTGADAVSLKWEPVTGAAGYSVYRATSLNGAYSYAGGTEAQDDVELTVSNLTKGNRYYFKVRAYSMENGVKVLSPQYSDVKSLVISLASPEWVSVTQTAPGEATLIWLPVEGADGYSVYSSMGGNGSYSYAGGTTAQSATELTLSGLTENATYYIRVRAFEMIDGQKVLSEHYSETYELVVKALEATYDDFSYGYNEEHTGIVITAYLGTDATVVVPERIENLPVVEIGEGAFEGNSSLVSVDLPDTVEIIRRRAFADCTALKSME